MKNPTYIKNGIVVLLLLLCLQSFAQNYVPFTPRFDQDLKGDILLIGNNILGPSNTPFNNTRAYNHFENMRYIDIDGDSSTFSSSSADLVIPNPECYKIVHAGLYWGAVAPGSEPILNVKLKGPSGAYNDVVGTAIYNANGVATGNSFPYSCYADVTSIVTGLASNTGTYTVGNVSSAQGRTASFRPFNGTGYSAGWSLFIVYEDPTMPGKSITSFDGFSSINRSVNTNIPISGFRTLPAPIPVRANFAFASLEGDAPIPGDRLKINGTRMSAIDRNANNFFNSSVTQLSALPVNNRNPNSTNTLGFDTGIMVVPNPKNSVIANNATSATIRLESVQDAYFAYFFAFAVEIIEPKIVLTKIVEDAMGNDIGGQNVNLGDQLNYVIGFQNTGNDDASGLTIRDILPINIIFDYPSDLEQLPPGVSVSSFDPISREIVFKIEDYVVEENDPLLEIRFKVKVVPSCDKLSEACSNSIDNQAFATYNGTLNPNFTVSNDPSLNSNTGCLLIPKATNFLADVDNCKFIETEVLCGTSVELKAANGYNSYSWSNSPTGSPVIGTSQSLTVSAIGTYYVHNTAKAPCLSINQKFIVTLFGGDLSNPVIPFADQVVTCPNDGKLLPNIFLCGANDSKLIQTNISDGSTMIWEKLDEASCPAISDPDCANENTSCSWNEVATGPDFLADTSGQYRLTLNYEGGCFIQFYFNVYENLLKPTFKSKDIFCSTSGEIVIGGVPKGYEYSIDGITYQPSNIFSIKTPNIYTIYVRQVGVTPNPCIFSVPDVQIRRRDFTVSIDVSPPLCNAGKGSVKLAANDVRAQYWYSIYDGATLVNSVGPIKESDYTFNNLNPGIYTVNVSTDDGCTYKGDIEITNPPILKATSALTTPITCNEGKITIYPVGGTPPYFYFVNSTTDFQVLPEIVVPTSGDYNITVVDSNNCSANTSITVKAIPAPEFNITKTDILCSGSGNTGNITVNVTNAHGNSLEYSIDGGATFVSSPVFTGLSAGNYDVVVAYTIGTEACKSNSQTITITELPAITGIATLTTPYTCVSTGTITVSGVSGGTAPYTYSIDGITFQGGLIFSGLTNGTYTITIKDDNECTFNTNTINVLALNPPTDLMFNSTDLSCPLNTSKITITDTTGGFGALEYKITAPAASATAYQISNEFSGLAPDTYTFQVKDAHNCVYSESYTIASLPALTVVGQKLSDISCFGAADGAVRYTVSGSIGFTYTINASASMAGTSPINLTGLAAGAYSIIITDTATKCTATNSVTVNTPAAALVVSTTVSPITCKENGSVVINAVGGWGGNSYTLTMPDTTILPPQESNTFTSLTQEGTYTYTVTDTNGCKATGTFSLSLPTAPTAVIATSGFCYDSTNAAKLVVTAAGGQTPYEYNINGGPFQSNNTFSNLIPGNYTIIVRDAYGCTFTLPAETIAPQITVNTVLTKDLDCSVSPNAIITGTISGGYAPFTYAVSIDSGTYKSLGTTGSPFTYSTSTAGTTYQFRITDSKRCIAESGIQTVNAISLPEITSVTQTQPILCNGDSNASIQVTINTLVGTPPFNINVNNDTTGMDYGTQTSGLPAGNYTITLTDSKFCTNTKTISINEPEAITLINPHTVSISCDEFLGFIEGSVIIDGVDGGTPPYNYYVTGTNGYSASELNVSGSTSTTFNVVDFGLYQINVVDANGCSELKQDLLVASPPNSFDITVTSPPADCSTGGSALVGIRTALAGEGPFHFAIYTGPGMTYASPTVPPWQDEDAVGSKKTTFIDLLPGVKYTYIVFDEDSGCYYYETATTPIPTNSTLTASASTSNNITCKGSADGNVSFDINSIYPVTTNVIYEIRKSQSPTSIILAGSGTVPANEKLTVSNFGPLPFGNYFVLIKEDVGATNAGCSVATTEFSITESALILEITATVDKNANCNPNSGLISAIAKDGTAPYLFQLTTSATAPLATGPSWASASTFKVDANSYYAHVMDAYGCIKSTPVALVVPSDPEPVISAVLNNQCTATEGNFDIDVTLTTAGIPPYSYSVDGGAFQTQVAPFTISNLSSGSHTVKVKDFNGCGNLETVNIEAPLGLTPTITALPTCADNDGIITLSLSGGSSGPFAYTISPSPVSIGLAGNVFSGVPSGSYTVKVTDVTTSCTKNVMVVLSAATPVTFVPTVKPVSCSGGNDGVITINLPISNDNPIYTYEITAGPITAPEQNSNIFTGLDSGNYTLKVNSGRGCSTTIIVPVGEPALLTVTGGATPFACAPDNSVITSTVSITEVGGTPPHTYSIDGTNYFTDNTFDIIDIGSPQTINIIVKDANGCLATNTVNITPLPTITTATVAMASPIDCNNTGTVAINVTGGSGDFLFQMLPSGIPQLSNIFSISAPGDYYFQVNDQTTGCSTATSAFNVPPFDLIAVVAAPATAITCFGDNNGAFQFNVSGYTGTYNYEVFDSSGASVRGIVAANTLTNPQIISGMLAGNYTVEVTETASPFCTTTSNVITIASPASTLTLDAQETSNVTCDNDKGTITAIATGGWGSYEYELTGAASVPFSSNGTFTDLKAGMYIVNVKDAGGCIVSKNVLLILPTPIAATVTASTSLLSCFGDDNASITVSNVTDGQGSNYSYILYMTSPTTSSSGPLQSPIFDGLGAGTYRVVVTDGYKCEYTSEEIIINEPTQMLATLVKSTSQTCIIGTELILSATGGTGPYTYSNTSSFAPALGSFTSPVTIPVPDGTFAYYVQDANGCEVIVSNEIKIDPFPELVINLDTTNAIINCAGDNTGVIVATAQGGLGNYIYTLQDVLGAHFPAIQNSPGVFTELVEGMYQVSVSSGDCLKTEEGIPITEPSLPMLVDEPTVTHVTCAGSNNGLVVINAAGGTGIIKYAISPQLNQFFESNIFENLAPGDYNYIAQDELGCFVFDNFKIEEPTPVMLTIVPSSIIPEVCEGNLKGKFSIEISGGTLPYSVAIDDVDGVYTTGDLTQTRFDFSGLGGGDHIVYVLDSETCESEWNISFPESVKIAPVITVDYGCTENTTINTITVTVDSSITNPADLDYSLDGTNYQASNIFTNVAPGTDNFINVRHTNGCVQKTDNFNIIKIDPLELAINDGGLNEIVALATGGSGGYQYTLNGRDYGSTNSFIIYSSGDYTVTVTDRNGCTAIATKYFEYIDICIPNYFTPNSDGVSDGWAPGCTINYKDLVFSIFDRYGRQIGIYREGEKWDGKYNGAELPTGDYWYVLKLNNFKDDREFVGHFTLYR